MSYALRVGKRVPYDIRDAHAFYEQRSDGLGEKLVREIYHMIDLVLENPFLFQKRDGEYRMATTRRYHYKVIYRIYETYVRVVAIQHPSQHPNAWKQRV